MARNQTDVFYHGTSDRLCVEHTLLPSDETGIICESGRQKNTGVVFFTRDPGLAWIYARKAVRKFGGNPVVYRVIPMTEVVCLSDRPGATVYCSTWGFVERVEFP